MKEEAGLSKHLASLLLFLSGSTFQLPLPPYRLFPEEPVSHQ